MRDEADFFDDIPNIKIEKEMLDLAKHIVQTKSAHFNPDKFEDRYETAVREVIKKKAAGHKIGPKAREKPSNVISLMDALKKSIAAERGQDEAPARSGSAKRSRATKKSAARKPAKKARKAG